MAGGSTFHHPTQRKIKGKKLTVLRFFSVSVAYTIGWYTISSELDYFKRLFGPHILLQLNIAYFVPSIPLLLISGQYDDLLEERFGTVPVVLTRLSTGLVGCALITAFFPLVFYLHNEALAHRFILAATVVLGLCTGTAFSASYQLVSRFANKNVIALGLGFVGSGVLTLIIQVVLELAPLKAWLRQLLLYEIVTALTVLGLIGALVIIFRKWREIEDIAAAERATHKVVASSHSQVAEPISVHHLKQQAGPYLTVRRSSDSCPGDMPAVTENQGAVALWEDDTERFEGSVQITPVSDSRLPSLAAFDFTDPYQSLPLWDGDDGGEPMKPGSLPGFSFLSPLSGEHSRSASRRSSVGYGLRMPLLHDQSSDNQANEHMATASRIASAAAALSSAEDGGQPPRGANAPGEAECNAEHSHQPSQMTSILTAIWPVSTALFLSGVTILVVFPFFTYVESSGWCGERLPKVLFFVRLFGDIVGRLMPRTRLFSLSSPLTILALAVLMFSSVPAYFWYLKAPPAVRCDYLIIGYIVALWLLCGYINTLCNLTAPKLVKPALKSGAAGLMAITFQLSHFIGLVMAIGVSYALFGGLA